VTKEFRHLWPRQRRQARLQLFQALPSALVCLRSRLSRSPRAPSSASHVLGPLFLRSASCIRLLLWHSPSPHLGLDPPSLSLTLFPSLHTYVVPATSPPLLGNTVIHVLLFSFSSTASEPSVDARTPARSLCLSKHENKPPTYCLGSPPPIENSNTTRTPNTPISHVDASLRSRFPPTSHLPALQRSSF